MTKVLKPPLNFDFWSAVFGHLSHYRFRQKSTAIWEQTDLQTVSVVIYISFWERRHRIPLWCTLCHVSLTLLQSELQFACHLLLLFKSPLFLFLPFSCLSLLWGWLISVVGEDITVYPLKRFLSFLILHRLCIYTDACIVVGHHFISVCLLSEFINTCKKLNVEEIITKGGAWLYLVNWLLHNLSP